MRVSRATNLGEVPAKKDDGWADDDAEEVRPQVASKAAEAAESDSSNDYEKVEHTDAASK